MATAIPSFQSVYPFHPQDDFHTIQVFQMQTPEHRENKRMSALPKAAPQGSNWCGSKQPTAFHAPWVAAPCKRTWQPRALVLLGGNELKPGPPRRLEQPMPILKPTLPPVRAVWGLCLSHRDQERSLLPLPLANILHPGLHSLHCHLAPCFHESSRDPAGRFLLCLSPQMPKGLD